MMALAHQQTTHANTMLHGYVTHVTRRHTAHTHRKHTVTLDNGSIDPACVIQYGAPCSPSARSSSLARAPPVIRLPKYVQLRVKLAGRGSSPHFELVRGPIGLPDQIGKIGLINGLPIHLLDRVVW